jgi:sigma-54 dependent transcriptional regulator, acetoin dehydrogenase operon transcriptional activator AcoR
MRQAIDRSMSRPPTHLNRIKAARAQLLDRGVVPEDLLPEPIGRSWLRCMDTGLSLEVTPEIEPMSTQALLELQEKSSRLLHQARPEMESLQSQIAGTQSMIVLTDATGTILHALGDPQFISRAQRVALQPGVSWREENTGTNAIGTALVEQGPVLVNGAEHYFNQNAFLTCSAAPILDSQNNIIGVLDVSGDSRQPQAHTLALVRMSAQMIENRLLAAEFAHDVLLHFHARPEFIGTLWEGIAAFSPNGRLLAINKSGCTQLGLNPEQIYGMEFSAMFNGSLPLLIDSARRALPQCAQLTMHGGIRLNVKVDPGIRMMAGMHPRQSSDKPASPSGSMQQLDAMDTGDASMRKAIESVKKVLGRNIPILIEGETGTGKELLAKAIHAASRQQKPFVAINCASIPEGLIEAELFGYEEGAFTGARRKGFPGKIQQANGGTLFMDEIGEMPLMLQARLLRVLQEREIVPLGAEKGIPIDMSIVSATNCMLRERVEQGLFREDLYYRLNGLRVTLPPLRAREDLETLIENILQEESDSHVTLDEEVTALIRRHPWRGNIRQLRNVLRAALAFMDKDHKILTEHLPEDFIEESCGSPRPSPQHKPRKAETGSIADAEIELIAQALRQHAGNVSAAARQLGIGRATLYRKIRSMGLH